MVLHYDKPLSLIITHKEVNRKTEIVQKDKRGEWLYRPSPLSDYIYMGTGGYLINFLNVLNVLPY